MLFLFSLYHILEIFSIHECLVVGEIREDGKSHGCRRGSNEHEAALLCVGHLIPHVLGPLPGVVVGLGGDAGLGVQGEIDLPNSTMGLIK